MRVRVYYPVKSRVTWTHGWHPYLLTESGRRYSPIQSGGSGAGNGQLTMTDSRLVFPPLDSPPVKLVWDLVEKAGPMRLFTFRMTDIPLPTEPGRAPAPGGAAPPAPAPTGETDHPFYQKGGGALVLPVRLGDRPAAEGTLQVGLARKGPRGYGPLRWTEASVGADGIARLAEVQPGTYRVQRSYRPLRPEGTPDLKQGRWQNPAAEVTVTAGKPITAPPLSWLPR